MCFSLERKRINGSLNVKTGINRLSFLSERKMEQHCAHKYFSRNE